MSALTTRCAVFAASRGVVRVLVFTLLVLLGAGGGRDAAAGPQAPEDMTAFSYEQYCDAKGRFTYDGAALKLVKRPAHLKRVYEDAARGDARARELVRELEQEFHQVGVVVADTTSRPACLPLPELTPECQPNWQFLKEFLGQTREAEWLREVVAHAYEERARQRGLKNQVIVAGVNLLLAGGLAKGVMTPTATAETRAAAAGRSGVATGAAPSLPAFVRGGKTVGVLRTASVDLPLQSGRTGPALSVPQGTSGFDIVTRTHVEGHAAAAMRAEGVSEATLYINNPNICPSCSTLLPRMLPPGSQLTVVTPSGSTTFVGVPP